MLLDLINTERRDLEDEKPFKLQETNFIVFCPETILTAHKQNKVFRWFSP